LIGDDVDNTCSVMEEGRCEAQAPANSAVSS
jgi:hypothetical protein